MLTIDRPNRSNLTVCRLFIVLAMCVESMMPRQKNDRPTPEKVSGHIIIHYNNQADRHIGSTFFYY